MAEGIRSGTMFGKVSMAYIFSGGSYMKTTLLRPVFAFLGFVMNWILLPAIAAGLVYFGYETAAYWAIGLFAVLEFFRIIFLPRNIIRWRERKKGKETIMKAYTDLMQIRSIVSNNTLNPAQIRNRIVEAEKDYTLFKPAVHSIVDRMIQRDPAVFTTNF